MTDDHSTEPQKKWRQEPGLYRLHAEEHRTWCNMKRRCYYLKCSSYARYGGRGIGVCPHWLDSFKAFFEDMGPKPSPGHSIDRLDSTLGYTCGHCEWCLTNGQPANCRWATRQGQADSRNRTQAAFRALWKERTEKVKEQAKKAGRKELASRCDFMDSVFCDLLKRRRKPPKLYRHPSGQARTEVCGRSFYLGRYGAPETNQRHTRLVDLWKQLRQANDAPPASNSRPVILMLPP